LAVQGIVGRKIRYFQPTDENYKPALPFVAVIEGGETCVEADSPYGLVCAIIDIGYYDVEGEDVAWRMRADYAARAAAYFTALGKPTAVVDTLAGPPVWEPGDQKPEHTVWLDSDWTFVASLHNLGDIVLYERGDVSGFSRPLPVPLTRCELCAYYVPGEEKCLQFESDLKAVGQVKCLDGIARENLPALEAPGKGYRRLGVIEIPRERRKREKI